MKMVLTTITWITVLALGTAWAQDPPDRPGESRQMKTYACPGHPEVQATWPGRCPKCGQQLREKGWSPRRGEEAMRRAAPGPYYGPETLLQERQKLNLSDRQVRQLQEIAQAARQRAASVLTDSQRARLGSYARAQGPAGARGSFRGRLPDHNRDALRDQYRDRYRDDARDRDRDQARDRDRDRQRDQWAGGRRQTGWTGPIGNFSYTWRPRARLTDEDSEGGGDEGFGGGLGDEGFGGGFGDEGFGGGFGDEGFGNEGFGEGFGDEGLGNEGFGNEGFGEGFGNQGFGNEGFGNEGFGNEGFGNQRFGNERFGNERFGNEGFGRGEGFGNEGFGRGDFGGEGLGRGGAGGGMGTGGVGGFGGGATGR